MMDTHRRNLLRLSLLLLLFLVPVISAHAQTAEPGFTISLQRDFGYGGIGNDIQGLFTIRTAGPENLVKVEFYLDDNLMGSSSAEPFNFQFRTEDFPLGQHILYAVGTVSNGEQLRSNAVTPNFVAAEQGWRTTITIVVVIFVLVIGAMVLSGFITTFSRRGNKGGSEIPKSYGIFGAAVCPNCARPFSRHWWGLNLMAGKFDRCPHCGKWNIVRRATPDELTAAEQRLEAELAPQAPKMTGNTNELDSRELEDSKYVE